MQSDGIENSLAATAEKLIHTFHICYLDESEIVKNATHFLQILHHTPASVRQKPLLSDRKPCVQIKF